MAVTLTNNENYKISKAFSKHDTSPLVINFQNGILQGIGEHDFHGGIYLDNSSGKSKKRTVAALDNMLYVGEESENNVCRNLIVARNRNTGEVRLIEVGNVLLKALPEEEQNMKTEDQSSLDVADSRLKLSEAFGSKRQKRMLEQSKKTLIDMNTMKDQLEKTVNEMQIDALDISQHDVNPGLLVEKYAPPRDDDASSIQDVYKVADFLNDEQLETFKTIANCVLEDEKYEIEMSEYITQEIAALRESPNTNKVQICCLLLYADCIIRYLKEPYKKVTNLKYVLCTYSELINTFVLDNFSMTTDKGRMRPQSLKDKSVCYLLVLLLIAGNYIIRDAGKLSKFIGTTVPKISQMAKVVGAHVINDNKNVTFVLKLPLTAPPTSSMNKRRK